MIGKSSNKIIFRTVLVSALVVAAFAAVIGKLFYMQVVRYDFYKEKAVANQTRDVLVTPARGTIYDTKMKILAVSTSAEMVTVNPKKVDDDVQAQLIAKGLSEILGVSYDSVYKKTQKQSSYEIIKRSVDKETADLIRQFASDNDITAIIMGPDTK